MSSARLPVPRFELRDCHPRSINFAALKHAQHQRTLTFHSWSRDTLYDPLRLVQLHTPFPGWIFCNTQHCSHPAPDRKHRKEHNIPATWLSALEDPTRPTRAAQLAARSLEVQAPTTLNSRASRSSVVRPHLPLAADSLAVPAQLPRLAAVSSAALRLAAVERRHPKPRAEEDCLAQSPQAASKRACLEEPQQHHNPRAAPCSVPRRLQLAEENIRLEVVSLEAARLHRAEAALH